MIAPRSTREERGWQAGRTRWFRWGVIVCLAAAAWLALALSQVRASQPAARPSPPTAIAPALRLAMPGASPTVDPALVADEDNAQLVGMLYGGLVRLNARYQPVPAAAEHWTISPDHRTYTFTLRPGLRFSNGDPVTASDFAYSITRSLNPSLKSPSAPTYLLDIQGAGAVLARKTKTVSGLKVLNQRTLQITTRWPVAYFLTELTYPTSFALDRKQIEKYGTDSTAWYSNPIGSGPYKVKSWTPNQQMMLVPNPYFPERTPTMPRIEVSFAPLPDTGVYQYVTHNLDVSNLPVTDASIWNKPGVRQAAMLAIDGIYMNMHNKVLKKIGVRRALVEALPRTKVVRAAMGNAVMPFEGYVPPGEAGYDKYLHQLPDNASAARASLAQSGYPAGKHFPTMTLYYADDPALARLATRVAKTWHKALKITIATRALTLNTLLAKVQAGSLPLYIGGWSADYPDPHDWLSWQWRSDAVNNNVHYIDPTFDKLVERADVTWTPSERMHLYDQAQQVLINDVAWMPLYIPYRLEYIRSSVRHLNLTGYGLIPTAGDWASIRMNEQSPGRRAR